MNYFYKAMFLAKPVLSMYVVLLNESYPCDLHIGCEYVCSVPVQYRCFMQSNFSENILLFVYIICTNTELLYFCDSS